MKSKKLISLFACFAILLTICPQINAIDEISETKITEDIIVVNDVLDDEIEYIDASTSTNRNITSTTRAAYAINATVNANRIVRTTNDYDLDVDDKIIFNFTHTPALASSEFKIGIYEINTEKSTYLSHSDGVLNGTYTIKTAGEYKIEFKNLSTQAVKVSGTFTPVQFTDLGVPLCGQEGSNLCWAACSEMISEHYGYSVTQENIVKHVKDTEEMIDETGSPSEIKKAIEYATNNTHTCSGSYTSASGISNISDEIKSKRPVIMFFVKTNGNHVCVATAVDNQGIYVRYNDPSPLNSGKVVTKKYTDLLSSSTNTYTKYMTVS